MILNLLVFVGILLFLAYYFGVLFPNEVTDDTFSPKVFFYQNQKGSLPQIKSLCAPHQKIYERIPQELKEEIEFCILYYDDPTRL